VTFANDDGTALEHDQIVDGGTAVYHGETPTKASDESASYLFSGWDKPLTNIKADTTFTAQYAKTLKSFAVTFRNYDGSFLYSSSVAYGKDAVYQGPAPTHNEDATYSYQFSGWSVATTAITKDVVTYATYAKKARVYHVEFRNYDGSLLDQENTIYGGEVSYKGSTPTKAGDVKTAYVFKGWDQPLTAVKQDLVTYAKFEETSVYFTVRFTNFDGALLDEEHVAYGESAIYRGSTPTKPSEPTKYYVFAGWDLSLDKVYANRTLLAQYKEGSAPAANALSFLSSTNRPEATDATEKELLAKDANGAGCSFSYANLAPIALNWGRFNAGGYLACRAPLKGLSSLAVEFAESSSLSLSYGWFRKDGSVARRLSGYLLSDNTPFTFFADHPDFFELRYNGAVAIIKSISLAYDGLAYPDDFQGANYAMKSSALEFSSYDGESNSAVIPSSHQGLAVSSFAASALASSLARLTSLSLPSSISAYANGLLSGASSLQALSVAHVGLSANLDKTTDAVFGAYFGSAAYAGSSTAQQFYAPGQKTAYAVPNSLKDIEIREDTVLPYGAFSALSLIENVHFPAGLKSVSDYGFAYCTSLKEYPITSSLTAIGHYGFFDAGNLHELFLPITLLSVGNSAFSSTISAFYCAAPALPSSWASGFASNTVATIYWSCIAKGDNTDYSYIICFREDGYHVAITAYKGNAEKVSIPATIEGLSVTEIYTGAFRNKTTLKEVEFPASISSIGASAFASCTSLTSLVLPAKLVSLGDYAFQNCPLLSEVVLPASVLLLGQRVFDRNSGSLTLYCAGMTAQANWSAQWAGSASSEANKVIYDAIASYQDEAGFAGYLRADQSLGLSSYSGSGKELDLESISAHSVSRLREGFLKDNASLTYLRLNEGLKQIDDSCTGLTSLRTLILPASLTQIAPTAFASSISNLYACYYKGTSEQFAALNYSYFNANNVLVSYYSASKPDGSDASHTHWHYTADGLTPSIWEEE